MEKNGRFRKKMGTGGAKKAHALHLQQRTNMMTGVTPRGGVLFVGVMGFAVGSVG